MRLFLLTPALLTLFLPTLSAQQYDVPPSSYYELGQDANVEAAGRFIESLGAKAPDIAETSLRIEDVFVLPSGKLSVTIRNEAWKPITAWSIGILEGSSGAQALTSVHTVDNYSGGLYDGDYSPLQPGQNRVIEYDLARRKGFQWEDDPYRVLSVTVKAVAFDGGDVAGSDLRTMRTVIRRRHVRAVALARMETRLQAALRTGAVEPLLAESMRTADDSRDTTSMPRGLAGVLWTETQTLNRQWLSALRMSAPFSGAGRELDDVLDTLKANPNALRLAAEATLPFLRSEQDLLHTHLPPELRELLP